MRTFARILLGAIVATATVSSLWAAPINFSTGAPDGLIGTGSRPSGPGLIEIESADDFILNQDSILNNATFTGLLTGGAQLTDIEDVVVEIYRVFPKDSTDPPSGNVPTRTNSPSDVAFDVRDATGGTLSYSTSVINNSFTVANTVVNGINKIPNQTTGGEGPATGIEVLFDVTFNTPFSLPADHYFFVPQVGLSSGTFLWLSAPRPTNPPFVGDLQSWVRNGDLDPDWLRIGTDIVGGSPAPTFNASFSISGSAVPEPSSLVLLGTGFGALSLVARKRLVRS